MFRLHVDLYADLPGKLFLGSMGLLLLVAMVSGAVIYHRFMRRLDFGTVRARSGRRVRWLDLHNLLGVVTLGWLTVVGVTGVFNTTADLVMRHWRVNQLADMARPTKAARRSNRAGSLDAAVATGLKASPGMIPFWVAFPGTIWASPHHYAIFFRGDKAWSARLYQAGTDRRVDGRAHRHARHALVREGAEAVAAAALR